MNIKIKIFFAFIFISFIKLSTYAQGEINDQESKIFFQNYKTGALTITSNGFGGDFRFGKRINAFKKEILELGIDFPKHSKEARAESYYIPTTTFIYGKKNFVINFRTSYGREKEIYSKYDKGGIAIKLNYQIGGNIAILKPIYYQIVVAKNILTGTLEIEDLKFDGDLRQDIYGKSTFTMGLKEMSLNPGGFIKLGACFDYSPRANYINEVETGVIFDAYLSKLNIMASENKQFLFSFYLTYRVGKIVSARKMNLSKEREAELYGE
jgi:hypothetical protein